MIKEKVTAIIPTFNEELHIEAAIQSVSFADEIIVMDSFSTDQTIDLAKKHKVRILQRVFDDFSSQKNYAIDQATYNWIYILDADERVSKELRKEIAGLLIESKSFVGFYVYRTNFFMGKKMNYSGLQRDKVVRLFNRKYCKYDGKLVHETIAYDGELGFFDSRLEHYSYRGFDHYISKLNQYAWLQAKQLNINRKKVNLYHIFVKPPARFVIHYLIRFGFLDGFPGIVYAVTQSYAVITRYIKLWLLRRNLK